MKVGDLVEIYRHIPRHESGMVPVGKMGVGVIVDIEKHDRSYPKTAPDTVISYVTPDGNVESERMGENAGVVVTMKVIEEMD